MPARVFRKSENSPEKQAAINTKEAENAKLLAIRRLDDTELDAATIQIAHMLLQNIPCVQAVEIPTDQERDVTRGLTIYILTRTSVGNEYWHEFSMSSYAYRPGHKINSNNKVFWKGE